jgi:hypothetical protein
MWPKPMLVLSHICEWIHTRMILQRELAEDLLQLGLGGLVYKDIAR